LLLEEEKAFALRGGKGIHHEGKKEDYIRGGIYEEHNGGGGNLPSGEEKEFAIKGGERSM
jgi:hypothetical protein